jgi:ABC-2 type transport system ATP-binding protein
MADVVELCPRVLLIQEGKLLYDGALAALSTRLAPFKLLRLTLESGVHLNGSLPIGAEVLEQENGSLTLRIARECTAAVTAVLLNTLPVVDLAVEDPPIEAVIDQIYKGGAL